MSAEEAPAAKNQDDVVLSQIEAAQKMLDNLKSILIQPPVESNDAEPKSILTSIQSSIHKICDNIQNGSKSDTGPLNENDKDKENKNSEANVEAVKIKEEPKTLIGSIKVRSLDTLLDPKFTAIIELSDSEENSPSPEIRTDNTRAISTDKVVRGTSHISEASSKSKRKVSDSETDIESELQVHKIRKTANTKDRNDHSRKLKKKSSVVKNVAAEHSSSSDSEVTPARTRRCRINSPSSPTVKSKSKSSKKSGRKDSPKRSSDSESEPIGGRPSSLRTNKKDDTETERTKPKVVSVTPRECSDSSDGTSDAENDSTKSSRSKKATEKSKRYSKSPLNSKKKNRKNKKTVINQSSDSDSEEKTTKSSTSQKRLEIIVQNPNSQVGSAVNGKTVSNETNSKKKGLVTSESENEISEKPSKNDSKRNNTKSSPKKQHSGSSNEEDKSDSTKTSKKLKQLKHRQKVKAKNPEKMTESNSDEEDVEKSEKVKVTKKPKDKSPGKSSGAILSNVDAETPEQASSSNDDQTSSSEKTNETDSNSSDKQDDDANTSSAESERSTSLSTVLTVTPTKSILKCSDYLNATRTPASDKKVQFSEENNRIHTFEPSEQELSDTEEQGNRLRTRAQKKELKISDDIRKDKKFFSRCVVKLTQSVPKSADATTTTATVAAADIGVESSKRKEQPNMESSGKRKRRQGADGSSDSDDSVKQDEKKHKKSVPKKLFKLSDGSDDEAEVANGQSKKIGNKVSKKKASKMATDDGDHDEQDGDKETRRVPKLKLSLKGIANNTTDNAKSDEDEEDNDDTASEDASKAASTSSGDESSKQTAESDKEDKSSDEESPKVAKKNNVTTSDTDSSEEEQPRQRNKAKKKKKKPVLSDSDDDFVAGKAEADGSDSSKSSRGSNSDDDEKTPAKKPTKKRSRIKKVADSSDEEDKSTRKQIRKVINRDSLAETTKQAEKEEAQRKARIAERQAKYNNIYNPDDLESSALTKVVLDFNEETQEELLSVDPKLVKHLKPHQGRGVQFMWDACFESIDRARNTAGSGCILAHCMGLGKTLQVITLTHTLLCNEDKTGVKKVLVVCPLSTVLNWVAEYKKWLPDDDEVEVYNLVAFKQNRERVTHVMEWHRHGGVLVLGYDMFRNLSNEINKRISKKMRADFNTALVDPGPDLVVCDEGHLLKNEKTSLSKAMNRIKTLRRIVLTGTPLQNNLKEYYCMVQFVKANLLGTYKEYLNRFVNPITNGQYTDSTQNDTNLMRKRSHVLHKLLDGIVQRRDYAVLAPFLPPKHEYVIFISLTETQRNLYTHYLANFAQRASTGRTSFLFTDFQELQRICTHPRVLLDKSIQNRRLQEKRDWENDEDSEGSLKDFIDDGSDTADSTSSDSGDGSDNDDKPKAPTTRRTRASAALDPEEEEEEVAAPVEDEWWRQFTQGDELDNIIYSGKLSLLFEILHQCELIGDKVLVFSQSLLSLNVIEYFLSKIDEAAQTGDSSMLKGYASSWTLGLDYFRLDGSSSCDNRAAWCKTFNNPENTRARLFLISTRAGGLGINLVAANRVIIFDVSWNPSHDLQSIYRVYRFGQTKPSFIYRFVTLGTMEMKVYERQVTKQAISKRVIDEQQIDRHYNQNDLQELYKFDPQPEERPPPVPPKDILLGELMQTYTDIIFKYHEHQSLLENKEDEVLNEEERKAAWEEFENEKQMQRTASGTINNIPMHTVVQALTSIIKREHPAFTALEINGVMPQLIAELRGQLANGEMAIFTKMLAEIRAIKAAEQARLNEYYKQQQSVWMMQQMQRQFPGLTPAVAERLLQSNNATQFAGAMDNGSVARQPPPATPRPAPTLVNPTEIVNLDED